MVAKRPIVDRTPTEHLHALRLEFGTKPETLPLLRRIFEDSLAPHITALLASENITDIDTYADKANEKYILYEPNNPITIAKITTSEMSFCNNELLQTLKALTTEVASLTADINKIKTSPPENTYHGGTETFDENTVDYQPQNSAYKQPAPNRNQPQLHASSYRQTAPAFS